MKASRDNYDDKMEKGLRETRWEPPPAYSTICDDFVADVEPFYRRLYQQLRLWVIRIGKKPWGQRQYEYQYWLEQEQEEDQR